MKLTKADKEYLKSIGYDNRDFEQIEKASGKTIYTLCNEYTGDEITITIDKAIELLGRKVYLSGISRSAFHWGCVRETETKGINVYFDSSKFFR